MDVLEICVNAIIWMEQSEGENLWGDLVNAQ